MASEAVARDLRLVMFAAALGVVLKVSSLFCRSFLTVSLHDSFIHLLFLFLPEAFKVVVYFALVRMKPVGRCIV